MLTKKEKKVIIYMKENDIIMKVSYIGQSAAANRLWSGKRFFADGIQSHKHPPKAAGTDFTALLLTKGNR